MKILRALLVISLSLGFISCTESIAPELEEANNGGGGGTPVGPGNNILRTFSVDVIKKNENDSTVMHKANQIGTEKCKIEAISLDANAPVYQDCVIDVEELDLFFNGLNIDIQVTDKLCEYVAFRPYKFYSHPVGASSGNYSVNECDPACSNISACVHNPPPANACQFNHGDGADCDVGSYNVTTYTSVFQVDPVTGDELTSCDISTTLETIPCDGDVLACVKTPNPEILGSDMSYSGKIAKVIDEDENGGGDEEDDTDEEETRKIFSLNYEFEGGIDLGLRSNVSIANFSNKCSGANPSLNEQPGMNFSNILAKFHQKPVSEAVTSPVPGTAMAASPLLGVYAQPLYLAQCLDQAGDVKGEIRFVVREWDRRFTQHTNPAILSYTRVNGWLDTDMNSQWNQQWDLDDFIENSGNKNYFNGACHTASLPLGYDPDHFFYNRL